LHRDRVSKFGSVSTTVVSLSRRRGVSVFDSLSHGTASDGIRHCHGISG
jgi:hypothetical protein